MKDSDTKGNVGRKLFWILFILKKEVFVMEENEKITLTPEMEEELSNGKEEGEE